MTRLFPGTRKDVREGLLRSHALLEQGGFIAPKAAGIWYLLPLGHRVHEKIKKIVFEVLEKHGAMNMTLPILQPAEDWKHSGRWQKYIDTKTMYTTQEMYGQEQYGLAPTAEEMATTLACQHVKSYRDLPLIIHQIGPKFRDEMRPRYGLLRGREFVMSDAYSFDRDEDAMRASFENMRQAYAEIFTACGLRFISVQADSGAIGGKGSSEFMALSDNGEDTLLTCSNCDYGANQERAVAKIPAAKIDAKEQKKEKVATPGVNTIASLVTFFKIPATQTMKAVLYSADGQLVVAFIRGDLDINDVKLQNHLGATVLEPAAEVMLKDAGLPAGSIGPVGLPENVRTVYDASLEGGKNFVSGANEHEYHYINLNAGQDFAVEEFVDIAKAQEGQECLQCGKGTLKVSRGIEVGHVFMLQKVYAEKFNAKYLDETGKEQIMWMGTYGIGTTRLMQAVAEQQNDEHGLIWPETVAPYRTVIVPVNVSDDTQRQLANDVYEALQKAGVEVLLDDRELKGGEKFMDADLMGIPWHIVCGREAKNGKVELKNRQTGNRETIDIEELLQRFDGGR